MIESDEVKSALICNTIERCCFDVVKVDDITKLTVNLMNLSPHLIIISSCTNGVEVDDAINRIKATLVLSMLPIMLILDKSELTEKKGAKIANNIKEIMYRPFLANELMSMIKSLLRKSQPVFQEKIIHYKDITIDRATYKVFYKKRLVHLGPTEFEILQLLMQYPERIYSREHIIEYVWGRDKVIESRTVDVHINRLRRLIKQDNNEQFIHTIRTQGYCLSITPNCAT